MRRLAHALTVALAAMATAGFAAAAGAAQGDTAVDVAVERGEAAGQTPRWIAVRVTVTEGGRPYQPEHTVFAVARNARGDQTEAFGFKLLELDEPGAAPGTHEGFVIVPYGGPWTITANANLQQESDAVPVVLGRGSLDVDVAGPATPATGVATDTAAASPGADAADSDNVGVAVLWFHTMSAIGWAGAVALLALLALPAGRRMLSEAGANALDGRLDRIIRAGWWLTGLVIASGIYNLVKEVAYRVPLSPDQARRLFDLPYAQPYYATLTVKLTVYAVMLAASVPLIREARRRATFTAGTGDSRTGAVVADDDPSPWDDPIRIDAGETTRGRVALRSRPAAVPVAVTSDDRFEGRAVRRSGALIVAGGVTIVAAVTLLKHLHLLAEVSRLGG